MSGRLFAGAVPFLLWGAISSINPGAPSPTRYRIDSKIEQIVDLSAMGQGNQTTSFTQLAIISVTLSDTVGGQIMHVVIDSLSSDAPVPSPEILQKARGAWLHGTVDAWGRGRVTATSADSNEMVSQMKGMMARFFPIIKPGAKEGDAWLDTAKVDTKTPSQSMKSMTVTTFTHGGSATHDGLPAARIDAASATSGAGTMENPMAGTMDVELHTTATASYFVGSAGRFLGSESKSDGKSLVRTPMSPDPIPVAIKQTTMISVLK